MLGERKLQKRMLSRIVSALLLAIVFLPFLMSGISIAKARISARTPNFWLLAIEEMREYQERDGQRLILELLHYPNWNNSTEYTSHIHLLSEYNSEEVSEEIKPCLVGYPFNFLVHREITDFLGQAAPGDVVVLYVECHGSPEYLKGIPVSYSELNDWLSSGNLPLCYLTVIIESCDSGNSIGDGQGGILGPNHNVLCGCMAQESCSGWAGEGNYMFFSHLINEGFSLGEDKDNDGWISAKEAFTYAKPITEQWIWDAFQWDQRPVSYYDQVDGNVPLVQREIARTMPDLPPVIDVISPQNATYTKVFVPLIFSASEPLAWIGYSLDDLPNITIVGNVILVGLSQGSHTIVFYSSDVSGNVGRSTKTFFSVETDVAPVVTNVESDMMKLTSMGKTLLVYIEPLLSLNLSEIDVSSIRLNETILADSESLKLGDRDSDGASELVMTFDWTTVSELILSEHTMFGDVTLTVSGHLCGGTFFEGSDTLIVRMSGDINVDGKVDMKDVGYAANAFGCCLGQPKWNSIVDENEDGRVDLRDIGLIAREFGKNYT